MKAQSSSSWRDTNISKVRARQSLLLCTAVLVWTISYTFISIYLIPKISLPEALNWPFAALIAFIPVLIAKERWGQGYLKEFSSTKALGHNKISSLLVLLALIVLALGLTVYQFFMAQAAEGFFKLFGYTSQLANDVSSPKLSISYFIYASLCGPLVEELIFRGVLLMALRPWGRWAAIVLSALSFGLMHHDIQQAISAATLGIFLAYVALRWGLVYSMLLHVVGNTWINIGGLIEQGSLLATIYFATQLLVAVVSLCIAGYILVKKLRLLCISGKKKSPLMFSGTQGEIGNDLQEDFDIQEDVSATFDSKSRLEASTGYKSNSQRFGRTQIWALLPLCIMLGFDLFCCLRFSLIPLAG